MGKLDTIMVNGPEGDVLDWGAVDWRQAEDDVRRLRQRIFTASQAGDLKKVRNLQKLMLRSRANALLSVRRVTEVNAGRKTAGVDGRIVLGGWEKAELVFWLQDGATSWRPRPVKRIFIPKAGGKRRGLGIPVIADRALQALTAGALEPEWEARFESRSYGFRPGRSCQDAMQAVFVTARGKTCKRLWALDTDLAAAFDRIDHSYLLGQLGTFPARGRIEQWLKAGVIDQGRFAPTEQGSPQGGVITPPTQWVTRAMVTLRIGFAVVLAGGGAVLPGRDAVPDGDPFRADEDVLDEQPEHALAFCDGGGGGVVAELAEEVFEAVGEFEVGLAVGELGVQGVYLGAQGGFAGAQVRHPGAELVDGEQLFLEGLDHGGDRGGGLGQLVLQLPALAGDRVGGAGGVQPLGRSRRGSARGRRAGA